MSRTLAVLLLLLLTSTPAGARDRGADGHFDTRTSSHFVLHQDVDIDQTGGFHGSRRFEQLLLATLERAYESADRLLGLRPERKLNVIVYDPDRFDREFSGLFRFPAAGFYAGVIRVRGATELTVPLQRVLHHELVHAALDAAAPSMVFPAWVNEGGAEWFESRALGKRSLSSHEWAMLRSYSRSGSLLSLAELSVPAFSRMGPKRAHAAYLQSYALIDQLVRRHGERDLARFYRELIRSRNLSRALSRVYRLDLKTLEARFLDELR
ncbi:MAG: peptidase MA family metallohydrolase [Deltaproteobacteria bacterium]|nr:peptidase MA family metallohydrolase [Deltaproteobacteria bacterium]